MAARALVAAAFAGAALVLPASAGADRPPYLVVGGSPAQRAAVGAALDRSAFPWGVLREVVVVQIAPGLESAATPGRVTLDANLLDAGTFAWGVVQHEFAHQVDFQLLDDGDRRTLAARLGAATWWGDEGTPHRARGAERFASLLAWAYWPSPENAMMPTGPRDEAAAMPPAAFRALLSEVLGLAEPHAQRRVAAAPANRLTRRARR